MSNTLTITPSGIVTTASYATSYTTISSHPHGWATNDYTLSDIIDQIKYEFDTTGTTLNTLVIQRADGSIEQLDVTDCIVKLDTIEKQSIDPDQAYIQAMQIL